MDFIELQPEHEYEFKSFIKESIHARKLDNDPLWQNIEFIKEGRKIYAAIDNGEIIQTIATNKFPNMPWSRTDTQLTKKGLAFFDTQNSTTELFKLMLSSSEKDGIWGHWYVRNAKLDAAMKRRHARKIQGVSMSRFALPVVEIFDEKYSFTEAARVKAGTTTGVKTYDWLMGNSALPYDITIRFLMLKLEHITSQDFVRKITYG